MTRILLRKNIADQFEKTHKINVIISLKGKDFR